MTSRDVRNPLNVIALSAVPSGDMFRYCEHMLPCLAGTCPELQLQTSNTWVQLSCFDVQNLWAARLLKIISTCQGNSEVTST